MSLESQLAATEGFSTQDASEVARAISELGIDRVNDLTKEAFSNAFGSRINKRTLLLATWKALQEWKTKQQQRRSPLAVAVDQATTNNNNNDDTTQRTSNPVRMELKPIQLPPPLTNTQHETIAKAQPTPPPPTTTTRKKLRFDEPCCSSRIQRKTSMQSNSTVNSIEFSVDGSIMYAAFDDGILDMWSFQHTITGSTSTTTPFLARRLEANRFGRASSVAVSPRGDSVACGFKHGEIQVWDVNSLAFQHKLHYHGTGVICMQFTPSGTFLASVDRSQVLIIQASEDWPMVRSMRPHFASVSCLAFIDETSLVTGSLDCTLKLADISTGLVSREFHRHGNYVTGVAHCSTHGVVVSCSDDGSIIVWDMTTPPRKRHDQHHEQQSQGVIKRLASAHHGDDPYGIDEIKSISVSGPLLASAGGNAVRVWSLPDLALVAILRWAHRLKIVRFRPPTTAAGDQQIHVVGTGWECTWLQVWEW